MDAHLTAEGVHIDTHLKQREAELAYFSAPFLIDHIIRLERDKHYAMGALERLTWRWNGASLCHYYECRFCGVTDGGYPHAEGCKAFGVVAPARPPQQRLHGQEAK